MCVYLRVFVSHNKVRLMNGFGARQGRSVSVTLAVPLLLARGTRCGSSVVDTTKLFIYNFMLPLLRVRCVCVDLPSSSVAGVSFFEGEAGKTLQLSHWSSLEIGRNIIKMKRECVHRRESSVPENVYVSFQELRMKAPINSFICLIFFIPCIITVLEIVSSVWGRIQFGFPVSRSLNCSRMDNTV